MGLSREVDRLFIEPYLPAEWYHCAIVYRFTETVYHIKIEQRHAAGRLVQQGFALMALMFALRLVLNA
jgi:cellobiose phosphorylase